MRHILSLTLPLLLLPVAAQPELTKETPLALSMEKFVYFLQQPLYVTAPPQDVDHIYIVEKRGRILEADIATGAFRTWLNIEDRVKSDGDEQGLLSLAFHPDYAENGRFFVYYTRLDEDMRLARFTVSADAKSGDPDSETELILIDKPSGRHNGGNLVFGPNDGYLYLGVGDGQLANDPLNRAQDPAYLLGKILRINVDDGLRYGIPPDNPYVNDPTARPEVWALGLRNPWRISFDRANGDLYIGDVGQDSREEINVQPADSQGGENYGWRVAEGFSCRGGAGTCGFDPGFTPPLIDFARTEARSITGGYVYRGPTKSLQGAYIFGDFWTGRVWSLRYEDGDHHHFEEHTTTIDPNRVLPFTLASFGEDAVGNLYIAAINLGIVYRVSVEAGSHDLEDIDHNGVVDIRDLNIVVQAILQQDIGDLDADLNDDGAANVIDLFIVVNAVLNRSF
jgi:glucose/arabinose dehydrogenase